MTYPAIPDYPPNPGESSQNRKISVGICGSGTIWHRHFILLIQLTVKQLCEKPAIVGTTGKDWYGPCLMRVVSNIPL